MVYTQLFDLCKHIVEPVWGKSDIEIFCSWDQREICFQRACRVSPSHVNHPSGYSWDLTFLFTEHSRNSLNICQDVPRAGDTLNRLLPLKCRIFSFREQIRKDKDLSLLDNALCFLSEIFRGSSWALCTERSKSGNQRYAWLGCP